MEILRSILLYSESKGFNFVVIGGHAVNAYGVSRHTADIDFVVPLKDKEFWQDTMKILKYNQGQNDDRFSKFTPKNLDNWPIDIMYVDDNTFEKILSSSTIADFGDFETRVAAPEHLILMKLHALKYFQEHRFSKDYSDTISLIKYSKLDYESKEFKQQCEKYATIDLYERIVKDLKLSDKN